MWQVPTAGKEDEGPTLVLAGSPKRLGLAHSSGSGPRVLSSANSMLEPMPPWGTSVLGVCRHSPAHLPHPRVYQSRTRPSIQMKPRTVLHNIG